MTSLYECPIALDPEASAAARVLRRLPLAAPGGLDEARLRDLLFRFPEALPVAALDRAYWPPIPVCRELTTPAGWMTPPARAFAVAVAAHGLNRLREAAR